MSTGMQQKNAILVTNGWLARACVTCTGAKGSWQQSLVQNASASKGYRVQGVAPYSSLPCTLEVCGAAYGARKTIGFFGNIVW